MYQIRASFALAEQRSMTYWWALLCEAMRCQGLGYNNPHYLPEMLGDYYFFDTSGDMEDKSRQSFRQMWDDLHADNCQRIYTSFWSQAQPYFWLAGTINQDQETHAVTLTCDLEDLREQEAESPEASTRAATCAVYEWLEVLKQIARLCGPCTAELTQERWGVYYRIGTIGKPLVLEWWDSPTKHSSYKGDIVQERLPDGTVLSMVTPLRFIWRGDAIPITLRDGEVTQEQDRA